MRLVKWIAVTWTLVAQAQGLGKQASDFLDEARVHLSAGRSLDAIASYEQALGKSCWRGWESVRAILEM
jgi:hypothetical protein